MEPVVRTGGMSLGDLMASGSDRPRRRVAAAVDLDMFRPPSRQARATGGTERASVSDFGGSLGDLMSQPRSDRRRAPVDTSAYEPVARNGGGRRGPAADWDGGGLGGPAEPRASRAQREHEELFNTLSSAEEPNAAGAGKAFGRLAAVVYKEQRPETASASPSKSHSTRNEWCVSGMGQPPDGDVLTAAAAEARYVWRGSSRRTCCGASTAAGTCSTRSECASGLQGSLVEQGD